MRFEQTIILLPILWCDCLSTVRSHNWFK